MKLYVILLIKSSFRSCCLLLTLPAVCLRLNTTTIRSYVYSLGLVFTWLSLFDYSTVVHETSIIGQYNLVQQYWPLYLVNVAFDED